MTETQKTDQSNEQLAGLAKLCEPFKPNQISKLPKPTKRQTEIIRNSPREGIRCEECGQWHHPDVVHLDYVGHAALTSRLLEVDPFWNWEPLSFDENGQPRFNPHGMWIKLTVCGVTRLGFGDAQGKQGGDATKEIIGDALRNAAMRFGSALDLWHKGELHVVDDDTKPESKNKPVNTPESERTPFDSDALDICQDVKDIADSILMHENTPFLMAMQHLKNTIDEEGCTRDKLINAYNRNLEAIKGLGKQAFVAYQTYSKELAKDFE